MFSDMAGFTSLTQKNEALAMELLEEAFEERSCWLVWCNVEPRFDWLRGDVEFASLMKAMKFG